MTSIEVVWLYYLIAGLALGIGLILFRARRTLPVEDRILAAMVPLGMLVLAALLLRTLFLAPKLIHNGLRFAPTYAMTLGYGLYDGPEDGQALCTTYGPIFQLAFLPATVASSPTTAIILAEILVQLFYWVPLFVVQLKEARNWHQPWIVAMAAVICCAFYTYRCEPLHQAATVVHADAPAIAFAVCACSVLYFAKRPYSHLTCSLCSFFVGLSIWSKYSVATVPFGLLLYVWLAFGRASFFRLLLHLCIWGILMSGTLYCVFGGERLIYNTLTLTGTVPWNPGGKIELLFQATREMFYETLPLWIALVGCVWWDVQGRSAESATSWRQWLGDHRWTVFLMVGLALAPLCIRLRARFGSGPNTHSFAVYFILAATSLALLRKNARLAQPFARLLESLTKVLASVLIFGFVLLLAPGPLELYDAGTTVAINGDQIVFEYQKTHPGMLYFPDDPLPALMAEGKLYHSSFGVFNYVQLGTPMSATEFWAHVPPNAELICFAPDEAVIDRGHTHPVLRYIASKFTERPPSDSLGMALARLGWRVYQRR